MPPKKSVSKECPSCEKQVAVALKTCSCGHSFRKLNDHLVIMPQAVVAASSSAADTEVGGRRRTERVKREKPNFYDASQYVKTPRKRKPRVEAEVKKVRLERVVAERPERTGRSSEEGGDEPEVTACENIMADATPGELAKYTIVLSEINRKLGVVNPLFNC